MNSRSMVVFIASVLPASALAIPDACDGFGAVELSEPMSDADLRIHGTHRSDFAGVSIANIGDFNGDGFEDMAVGTPGDDTNGVNGGAVHVFFGPLDSLGALPTSAADLTLVGDAGLRAGFSVAAAGDVDGDGRADLLIGSDAARRSAYPTGVAWLVYGDPALSSTVDLNNADATFVGLATDSGFGQVVGAAGDHDADGTPDIVVGAPLDDAAGNNTGAAYVFSGLSTGEAPVNTAMVVYVGRTLNGRAGGAIANIGDVDGDGLDDLGIGARLDSTAGNNAGAVFVLPADSGAAGTVALATAPTIVEGEAGDRLGTSLAAAGDVDADGVGDLYVGASQYGAQSRGAVLQILGGPAFFGTLSGAEVFEARVLGKDAADLLGTAIATADLNVDGIDDLILGAARADGPAGAQTGAAWALALPISGEIRLDSTSGARYAQQRWAFGGQSVATFADVNGDGFDEFAVSAWRGREAGQPSRSGLVSFYLGGADFIDEQNWYIDADHDDYGDPATAIWQCLPPPGTQHQINRGGDCNDSDDAVHPFAPELDCASPIDFNCDGAVGTADLDGDGFGACLGDCVEGDPSVHPRADELCGDDIDNNCDGIFDDATSADAPTWYADADADGFGFEPFGIRSCEDPGVFLAPIHVGGDCDDANPAVNPDAVEFCDEIDNNCDGSVDDGAVDADVFFVDLDGDGHGDPSQGVEACERPSGTVRSGDDCDDADTDVFPGAAEVCDFKDNNCAGANYRGGLESLDNANLRVLAENSGAAALGSAVTFIADWDGDGRDELLVGAPEHTDDLSGGGAAYVLSGRSHVEDVQLGEMAFESYPEWSTRIRTPRTRSLLGADVASGDLNGDGVADLIIGAPGASSPANSSGAVYVFYGPTSGDLEIADADVTLSGDTAGDLFGSSLDAVDLDGDGIDDLLVGAPKADAQRRGISYVFYGSATWSSGLAGGIAAATVLGDVRAELGTAVSQAGDLDGDGFVDMAFGGPLSGGLEQGEIHVLYGSASRFSGALTADALLTGDVTAGAAGLSLSWGNLNGDAFDDLLIGSRKAAFIVQGSAARWSTGTVTDAAASVMYSQSTQGLGVDVAGVGDVNADGFDDFMVAAPRDDTNLDNAGAAALVYGGELPAAFTSPELESKGRVSVGTTFPTYSASNLNFVEGVLFFGEEEDERAASVVGGRGDLNGDGGLDLIVGSPNANSGSGRTDVMWGGRYGTDLPAPAPAPWSHPLTVDGLGDDWSASTNIPTGNPLSNWSITWDDTHLFVGSDDLNVSAGGPDHHLVITLGNGDAVGGSEGFGSGGQIPTLPFAWDYQLDWSPGGGDGWSTPAGRTENWLGTSGSTVASRFHNVEFSIPLSEIGDPSQLDVVAYWVFLSPTWGASFSAAPPSFADGEFDPDPSEYLSFDLTAPHAPSAYTSLPSNAGTPDLTSDYQTWYVDADGDGQATDSLESFDACEMHVPIDLNSLTRLAVLNPALATDCQDGIETVYLGAEELDDDGIDNDCDGYDNLNKLPILDVEIAPASPSAVDIVSVSVDVVDPDVGTDREAPITLSYAWWVNGTDTGETGTTLDPSFFAAGDQITVAVVADDTFELTPAYSDSVNVDNRAPVIDSLTIDARTFGTTDALQATAATSDVEGDVVSMACQWEVGQGGSFAPMAGETGTTMTPCLDTGLCAVGDQVRVTCVPNDGADDGLAVTSDPVDIELVLFAEENFDYDPVAQAHPPFIQGATDGAEGWKAPWSQNQFDPGDPDGTRLLTDLPMHYPGLDVGGTYLSGAHDYQSAGRLFEASEFGGRNHPTITDRIGRDGDTLWVSFMMRKNAYMFDGFKISLNSSTVPHDNNDRIAVGWWPAESVVGGVNVWTLRLRNETDDGFDYFPTTIPMVRGQEALAVLRIDFDAADTVSLFLNPTVGGGAPAIADTVQTVPNTDLSFRSLFFFPGPWAHAGDVDAFRIGTTFAAVTPAGSSIPVSPPDPCSVCAETKTMDGGHGTADFPWAICSNGALRQVAGTWDDHHKLCEDLDWSGEAPLIPTGAYSGDFDGGNHEISAITYQNWDGTDTGLGLVKELQGSMYDLHLVDMDLSVGNLSGGIAQRVLGTMSNVSFTGVMRPNASHMGGVAYAVTSTGVVDGAVVDMDVLPTASDLEFMGGITAFCSGTCTNLQTSGTMHIPGGNKIGGLFGDIGGVASNATSSMDVSGNRNIGGLCGTLFGGTITDAYASGSVAAVNQHAGGVCGELFLHPSTLTRVFAIGPVADAATVEGGVLGRASTTLTETDVYWDMDSTGRPTSAGGIGLTTAEFLDPLDPNMAAFQGGLWTHTVGEYPRLLIEP